LVDYFGRPWLKLRLIVDSSCNFKCIFCHFEGQSKLLKELDPDDYGFVASVAKELGVDDFKITGGEPLLRRDIVDIVRAVSSANPRDLSMTTNGYLLDIYAHELKKAGLRRLNISLHSLDEARYRFITGIRNFKRVLDNVEYVSQLGFDQVKINMVILRGINDDEVPSMIKFAGKYGFVLQIIELMPMGEGFPIFAKYYDDLSGLIRWLSTHGKLIGRRTDLHNRPVFLVDGVKVEIVKNYNNPAFCSGCTTMRLTSDGKLKTCLYKDPAVDLWAHIKSRNREEIIRLMSLANSLREPNFKGNVGVRIRLSGKINKPLGSP